MNIRGYQSGEITGANQMFRPRLATADADIRRALRVTVDRCRDQAINNPAIRGAIRRMVNNTVRDGIAPRFLFREAGGQLDVAANRAWRALFDRWAGYSGINRRQSLWTLQRLVLSTMFSDGECYVHRIWDNHIPGIPALRLELIERDLLNTSIDGQLDNGNIVRQGKEIDPKTGEFVAFHFLTRHPGDYQAQGSQNESRRIPASEIICVYDADRISQSAGMPWLSALVMESYDLQEYRDYERIGAKLAAAFGIFVRNNNATANPLGGLGMTGAAGTPESQWPGAWGNTVPALPDYIEPGRIQALPYGTDIVIASHNRPGSQYPAFVKESRRTQSAGLGISYEAYANDYTDASYSSARSGALEERLTYQGMQFFLSETLLDPICRWFIEATWMAGLSPVAMPDFAENPYPYLEQFVQQNPGWQWVDPSNDANASVLRIANGLTSKAREMAVQGLDLDEINDERLSELIKEREILKAQLENAKISAQLSEINGKNGNTPQAPSSTSP